MHHLQLLHPFPIQETLLTSDLLTNTISRGNTSIYRVLIIVLVLSVMLLLYALLKQTKSNRMLRRVEQMRSDICTKITYESRTPLTIILGLSRQLRDQKDLSSNNALTYLNAIERQGRNLSERVNQLLDISNVQTTPRNPEWKTGNIVIFVEMVSETFRSYARQKDIELLFFSEESELETDFIPDYLNKILHNLIDNAIKFSDAGTRIYVVTEKNRKNKKKLLIKVIDHGKGISKEALPHIFDLFYQGDSREGGAGNGIGLSLTKQWVEISGGTIHVKSKPGKGSVFTIELPLQKSEKQQHPHWIPEKNGMQQRAAPLKNIETGHIFSSRHNENDPRPKILLAEDNKDTALYIRSVLPEDTYHIIYTRNGDTALEMANEYMPDVVITDVIMPKKSGIELCKEIKASPLLNHLPVILISEKSNESDVIEGLNSGADSYIRKPFQPEELQAYTKNLLKSRQLLKDKYQRSVLKEEKHEINDNADVDFLRHVTDIIYREIKNPDFSPTKLAQELSISVSQLNKKLNTITGYPSSTYILQVKLSHARKILSTQNKNIGEVATECGIYDVNYFSRVFKKHTGLTPTQFRRLPEKTSG